MSKMLKGDMQPWNILGKMEIAIQALLRDTKWKFHCGTSTSDDYESIGIQVSVIVSSLRILDILQPTVNTLSSIRKWSGFENPKL